MKKTMLSLGVFALLGLSTQVFGQVETATEGPLSKDAVGINTDEPTATLDVNGGARVRKARAAVLPTDPKVKATEILVVDKDGNLLRLPISTTTLQELVGSTSGSGTQPGAGVPGQGGSSKVGVYPNFTARLGQTLSSDYDWTDGGKGYVDFYEFTVDGDTPLKLPDPTLPENEGRIIHYKNSTGGTIVYAGKGGKDYPKNTSSITAFSAQIVWCNGKEWYLIGGRN
ncbi:hypothetical protein MWN41_07155 [Ornithobacterium rhinotracheale]|uniref:hypothetical protein n=1 Tax=Ornithobacterium rhinotracheale TaxID=28251 RepID=UPI001FF2D9F7|nr:hypothetical protein [Ornithobacterium rhinotracheale]MCK0202796.1 hypothetical protein [Ornithobacterium rhinotracheale]